MVKKNKTASSVKIDRLLAVAALLLIAVTSIIGRLKSEVDLTPFLKQTLPEAVDFKQVSRDIYSVWSNQSEKKIIAYLALGKAQGYGGNLSVMVAVDPSGTILNSTIVEHKETFSFMRRLLKSNLPKTLKGKKYSHPFVLGEDLDGVSGATYTSIAIVKSVQLASRKIAKDMLKLPVPPLPKSRIQFGLAEILLLLLFSGSYLSSRRWFKYKRISRWIIMVLGLFTLGFALNKPFTLVMVNKTVLGFLPQWQTHLYWYLMMIGILFFLIIDNKNLYCDRVCPFGAAQECIGVIGGAKTRLAPTKYQPVFLWFQRGLALTVILGALIFSNPSFFTYEISGALFHLIGSVFQFSLLFMILILALFIKKPWCQYLCPLRPTFAFISTIRMWILEKWKKSSPKYHS